MSVFTNYLELRYYELLHVLLGRKKRDIIVRKREMHKNAKLVTKYGPEAIRLFSEVVKSEQSEYWLFWGSLLGAYRDNGFIKYDEDIDVGMYYEDMTTSLIENLIEKGFVCLYAIMDKDIKGGLHFALDFKGVKFDIYSFTRNADNSLSVLSPLPYNYGNDELEERTDIWEEVHAIVPAWDHLIEISFEGASTFIPSNSDEILKILYGENYKTPIIGYKPHDEFSSNKIHEDPQNVYACMMSFEMFKMFKHHVTD